MRNKTKTARALMTGFAALALIIALSLAAGSQKDKDMQSAQNTAPPEPPAIEALQNIKYRTATFGLG